MRVFLAAHHARLTAVGVEQHGSLFDAAAVLQRFDLPAYFVVDGLLQKAERVEVLDLAAGAEFGLADRAHRDVGVNAEAAFLHVAVANADPGHQRVQRAGVGDRFCGGAHLRLRDNLQQRRAGAIEVDAGHAVEVFVQRLAGVLFHMGAGEVDHSFGVAHLDLQRAALDNRLGQLTDLIALGQVGVEVVLAVEDVDAVKRCADRQAKLDRTFDRALVQHRQHAGQRDINRAGLGVGRCAEGSTAARKNLGTGGELGMHLQPNNGLPLHFKPSGARACQSVARWN